MVDYHVHLENGPYSMEWLQRFWQQAQERKISEIGITEHSSRFHDFRAVFEPLVSADEPYQYMEQWLAGEFQQSLHEYVEFLLTARKSGIPVRIGLEVDYFASGESEIKAILDKYPFDFVLGSIHTIGKWGFDHKPEFGWGDYSVSSAYRQYYGLLEQLIDSDLFDVIAHFDVIKVFGHRPADQDIQEIESIEGKLLKKMRTKELCLEVSTAGLRKPVRELYPSERILKRAGTLQVPICFASDAHQPEEVGWKWEQAAVIARQCGYKEYRIFDQRKSYAEKVPK